MPRKKDLFDIHQRLSRELSSISFAPPVAYVYDPTNYAKEPLRAYLERYGKSRKGVVLLGMNPGPFGMAQTGVPFGDPEMVRDWLGIEAPVGRPPSEHPKRKVTGFASKRGEVSGRRLWGWARERFAMPEGFFERFFVLNYCPLVFMEESGRNRTPDKLAKGERALLYAACDAALRDCVRILGPSIIVGVGAFAEKRAKEALSNCFSGKIGRILHPSPASPLANGGWAEAAEEDLLSLGVGLPKASAQRREVD